MSAMTQIVPSSRDLVLTRLMDAPREAVYRCWTDPELMKQWFVPPPFTVSSVETDVRVGGASNIIMRSPDGDEFPNPGVFLEVIPNEKLVFTDAYIRAWEPSERPFMTVILTFEDEGGKTRYTAIARHWSDESRKEHEEMGFHTGWGIAADQLEALAKTL
jgi:uncharacterized protein YndB with AHSA1/START domain